jgi:hypothetical protein
VVSESDTTLQNVSGRLSIQAVSGSMEVAAATTPPNVMGYRRIQVSRRDGNGEVDFGGSMVPPEVAPIDNGRRLRHRGRKDRELKF